MGIERLAGDDEARIHSLCCRLPAGHVISSVTMMMIRINIASVFFLSR
jgi:hypothetical protein